LSAAYDLRTTWRLEGAGAGEAWDTLEDVGRWPEWWHGLRRVSEVAPGRSDGLGQVARLEWRAALPYSIAAGGDLAGVGRFEIAEAGGVTTVVYAWEVETTKPWMRRTAPVLRPLFVWGHDHIMRAGGRGLAARLGARLL
jgi:hypothetical protein